MTSTSATVAAMSSRTPTRREERVGEGDEFRGGVAGRLHGVAFVRRTPVSALRRALRAHGSAFAPRAAANRAGGPSRSRRRTANTPVDGRR